MSRYKPIIETKIPSLCDGTIIDCRIYRADHSRGDLGAIIAHPYAPMGGNMDDPVVALAVSELLASGYIVGTFNFRGAGYSNGRTSWTSRPELMDYTSFAGFFIQYLIEYSWLSRSTSLQSAEQLIKVTFGGYSYGSMIASRMPSAQDVFAMFSRPEVESIEAQILSQARKHVGGDSIDCRPIDQLLRLRSHYLLISPLLPPITFLLAPFHNPFWCKSSQEKYHNLTSCRTLVVFGGNDVFTSSKRMQQWNEKLKVRAGSMLSSEEVAEAGHFWREPGVALELPRTIGQWARYTASAVGDT